MKAKNYLLFATLSYAYSILRPLQAEIRRRGGTAAWFLEPTCPDSLQDDELRLKTVREVIDFNPVAVFTPGNYIPDFFPGVKVALFRGTTSENLARSIDYELRLTRACHGAGIDRALARGNRLAARALIRAAASDIRHIVLMERLRDGVSSGAYRLCPRCGNLYEAVSTDPYCPICLTAGRNFIAIE